MQLRQHLLALLTTPVIVSLAGDSALAFSLILPSPDPVCNIYCSSLTYNAQNFGTIETYLAPIADVSGTFFDALALNTLNPSVWAQNGSTFTLSTTPLQGNFTITEYRPYASLTFVGADIRVFYNPAQGDPVGNTHWIQGVFNNHAVENTLSGPIDLGHGTLENKVDVVTEQTNPNYIYPQNPAKQTFNPYYDTFGQATAVSFYDIPNRRDVQESHTWLAALYLVQETAPKQVTVYNGFLWGWGNEYTPAPCTGGSGGGGCTQAVNRSGIPSGNIAVLPESVPESSSILGILLLGAWGVIQGMKIKNHKQQ